MCSYPFSFLCCLVFLSVFIMNLISPMLPVSLEYPFLIAPSVFPTVYLLISLVFCVVFFGFVCLRLVHQMLPVSIDCPLWICPVVFSNVYLLISLVLCRVFFLSSSWGLYVQCCLCLSMIHSYFIISIIALFNISWYVDWCWKKRNEMNICKQFRINKNVNIKFSAHNAFLG